MGIEVKSVNNGGNFCKTTLITSIYTFTPTHTYIYVYIYMYIYVCMYINTYTLFLATRLIYMHHISSVL